MFKSSLVFLFLCSSVFLGISLESFGGGFDEFSPEFQSRFQACLERTIRYRHGYCLCHSPMDDHYNGRYHSDLKRATEICREQVGREMSEEKRIRSEQKRLSSIEKEKKEKELQDQIIIFQKQLLDILLNTQAVTDPGFVQQLEILKKRVAILELELNKLKAGKPSDDDL